MFLASQKRSQPQVQIILSMTIASLTNRIPFNKRIIPVRINIVIKISNGIGIELVENLNYLLNQIGRIGEIQIGGKK